VVTLNDSNHADLTLTGLTVLIGTEINAESEREAATQAGHPQPRQR
jgi:hypothetical protein